MSDEIRVGYFTQENIPVSQTFVYDLICGLNADNEIDLVHFVGCLDRDKKSLSGVKTVGLGFNYDASATRWQKKMNHRLGIFNREKQFQNKIDYATSRLKKSKLSDINLAYVEFATCGVLLLDYMKNNNIPMIVHVHGYDVTAQLNNAAYQKKVTELYHEAKAFVAASEYMKRILILNGCPENKIHVVRLGIDSTEINPMPWSERKTKKKSVVFLGRFTPKKHPIALIEAFDLVLKRIPEATLSMIGDGPEYRKCIERVKAKKMEGAVRFLGALSRKESFPILNEHWVYAQHSVSAPNGDQEGFALSLSEAALHELPVVSTIHNGITENVIDGISGYLVPEFNYEQMADRLIELLESPTLCEQMGQAGRKHITKLCQPIERISSLKQILRENQ